jgi:hypothetical protein
VTPGRPGTPEGPVLPAGVPGLLEIQRRPGLDPELLAPVVQLWPTSTRVGLDGGQLRLLALAGLLLRAAGGRVRHGDPRGVREGLHAAGLSWLLDHDRFLADVRRAWAEGSGSGQGAGQRAGQGAGQGAGHGSGGSAGRLGSGIVVCDDPAVVARSIPEQGRVLGGRVLWASGAQCLLTLPDGPAAALTLTEFEARQLRAAGIDAVSLLSCGGCGAAPPQGSPNSQNPQNPQNPQDPQDPQGGAPDAPRRVVVLVDGLHLPRLDDVLDAVRHAFAVPAGPPWVDVLPEVPASVGGQEAAPPHPWVRSRLLRGAGVVVALGHAPVLDLGLAEASAHGVPGIRVLLAAPKGPLAVPAGPGMPAATGPLADLLSPVLPGGLRLAAPDVPAPAPDPAAPAPGIPASAADSTGATGTWPRSGGPVPAVAGAAAVVTAPPVLRAWLTRLVTGAPAPTAGVSRSTSVP